MMGSGVEEAKLIGGEAERWRIVSTSTWYKWQLGRWPGMPGRRGALELWLAPASWAKETREIERMSGRVV
jgi:hypothetical protein